MGVHPTSSGESLRSCTQRNVIRRLESEKGKNVTRQNRRRGAGPLCAGCFPAGGRRQVKLMWDKGMTQQLTVSQPLPGHFPLAVISLREEDEFAQCYK